MKKDYVKVLWDKKKMLLKGNLLENIDFIILSFNNAIKLAPNENAL